MIAKQSITAKFHIMGNEGEKGGSFNFRYWDDPDNRNLFSDSEVETYFGPLIDEISIRVPLKNKRKARSLLEIGGGKGDVADYLKRMGYDVVMVEAEDVAIGLSRGRGLNVHKSEYPQIHRIKGLSGKKFDAAFMTRVLEYPVMSEEYAKELIRSLIRIVRSGGPIIIATNRYGPVHRSALRNPGLSSMNEIEVDRSPYLGRLITATRL